LQCVPKVNRPDREAVHSLPRSTDVKNEWNYTSVPPTCLHGADSDTLRCTCTSGQHRHCMYPLHRHSACNGMDSPFASLHVSSVRGVETGRTTCVHPCVLSPELTNGFRLN